MLQPTLIDGNNKASKPRCKSDIRQAATLAKRPESWLIGCVETHFRICTRKDFNSYNQYIKISISQYINIQCIYIYILHIARRLTFARYLRNSMRDCNPLCCFRACFSHTGSMQNIDITFVPLHFCAYLRRCKNHILKRILKISSVICSALSC